MSDKLINNLIPSDPENIECELVSPDRKHSRLWKMKDGKVKMLAKSSMFAQPDPENPHSPKIIDNKFIERKGKFFVTGPENSATRFHTKSPRYDTSIDGNNVSVILTEIGGQPVGPFTVDLKRDDKVIEYSFTDHNIKMRFFQSTRGIHRVIIVPDENAPRVFKSEVYENKDCKHKFKPVTIAKDADGDKAKIQTSSTAKEDVQWMKKDSTKFEYSEAWTGEVYKIKDPATRVMDWVTNPTYPIKIDPTTEFKPTAGAQDVTQKVNNGSFSTINTGDNVVKLGWRVSTSGTTDRFGYHAGFGFPSISLSSATSVTSAKFKVYLKNMNVTNTSGSVYFELQGAGTANMTNAAWTASASFTTQVVLTGIQTGLGWTQYESSGWKTFSVTAFVNGILSNTGWADGNAMKLVLKPTNVPTTGTGNRRCIGEMSALEDSGYSREAILELTFAGAGGGGGGFNRIGMNGGFSG